MSNVFLILTFYFGIGLYFSVLTAENSSMMSTFLKYDETFRKLNDEQKEKIIKLMPYFILFAWPMSAFNSK